MTRDKIDSDKRKDGGEDRSRSLCRPSSGENRDKQIELLMDFKKAYGRSAGTEYMFVEQDECAGSPFDALKTSFENVREMGY